MRQAVPALFPDTLPWEPIGSLTRKLLSKDPDNGSETNLVRIPAGWVGGGVAHFHHCSEEAFVMDGDVTLTGREDLVDGSYLYRPAGIVHGHREAAKQGCMALIKLSQTLDFNLVEQPTSQDEYPQFPTTDPRGHVLHLRTPDAPAVVRGEGESRYETVTMSEDSAARSQSLVLRFPTTWHGRIALDPADAWEWFVTRGGITLEDGTRFGPNGYSFRPPGYAPAASIAQADSGTRLLLWRNT